MENKEKFSFKIKDKTFYVVGDNLNDNFLVKELYNILLAISLSLKNDCEFCIYDLKHINDKNEINLDKFDKIY